MTTSILLNSSRQTMRWLDLAAAVWTAGWLAVGVWVGYDLWQFAAVTGTVADTGHTLHNIAGTLHQIGSIPFVGGKIGQTADQINATASEIVATANANHGTVHQLAILLGLASGIIPLAPILGIYLPLRLRRQRQLATVQRVLAAHPRDEAMREVLAYQAAKNLPLDQLIAVTRTPWRDLAEGRHDDLANAELRRLGLRR